MKTLPTTPRKAAANRRNARRSTGPKTAAGKAAASLNALKHGLNTPVPDDMVRRCESQHRDLLDHVLASCDAAQGADVIYALAAHARLRAHRSELMRSVLEAAASDASTAGDALRQALTRLGRLHSYERKSASRLGALLQGR